MPTIVESTQLPLSAEELWREIGAFGSIGAWHPMLERVESEGDWKGAKRTAEAADGSTQVERLEDFDTRRHRYRYSMESTPLPVEDYVGELRIEDAGKGWSTVTWSVRFDVSHPGDGEVVDKIGGFLEVGIDGLKQEFGQGV